VPLCLESRLAVRMDCPPLHHIGSQTSPGNIVAASVILGRARSARGWQAQARHPSTDRTPGGGDGCREAQSVSGGDGPRGPPPGYARQRGRRMPADRPITPEPERAEHARSSDLCGGRGLAKTASISVRHVLPSGSATKRVPSPDFTRNNKACLPDLRASASCLRTSAGLDTDLPPTSRMTSPT
jgi:hypothetical protein